MTQTENQTPPSLKGSAILAGAGIMALFLALLAIAGSRDAMVQAVASIGSLLGLVVAVAALIHLARMKENPDHIAGKGWAQVGLACGLFAPAAWLLLAPTGSGHRELANRTACAANLNGIMKTMIVYADDNNARFPLVAPPAEAWTYRLNFGATAASEAQAKADTLSQAGSPASILWIPVVAGSMSSRTLLCKSDPWSDGTTGPMQIGDHWALAPQKSSQLSYSLAYPWQISKTGTIEPGPQWISATDSSLPIMSDMAPQAHRPAARRHHGLETLQQPQSPRRRPEHRLQRRPRRVDPQARRGQWRQHLDLQLQRSGHARPRPRTPAHHAPRHHHDPHPRPQDRQSRITPATPIETQISRFALPPATVATIPPAAADSTAPRSPAKAASPAPETPPASAACRSAAVTSMGVITSEAASPNHRPGGANVGNRTRNRRDTRSNNANCTRYGHSVAEA